MVQSRSQSPGNVQSSSPFSRHSNSNTAGNLSGQQARALAAAQGSARPATQISRQSSLAPPRVQTSTTPVRVDNLVDLTSEQNWRPTGRMRGSLTGRAYADALRQFITQPSQSAQPTRPQSNLTTPMPAAAAPPHSQMHSGNRSGPNSQSHNNPNTEPASTIGSSSMEMP